MSWIRRLLSASSASAAMIFICWWRSSDGDDHLSSAGSVTRRLAELVGTLQIRCATGAGSWPSAARSRDARRRWRARRRPTQFWLVGTEACARRAMVRRFWNWWLRRWASRHSPSPGGRGGIWIIAGLRSRFPPIPPRVSQRKPEGQESRHGYPPGASWGRVLAIDSGGGSTQVVLGTEPIAHVFAKSSAYRCR